MTTKANDPVLNVVQSLATKFNLQDISFRAYAGRIKKVTGIEMTPSEVISYMEDGEGLSKASYKKFSKFEAWLIKQAGNGVVQELEMAARPFMITILNMYLLGFVPKEVLIKKFKATKKMDKETGGMSNTDWGCVIADIEKFQESKSKKTAPKKRSSKAS